jgi:hypothetical protein
MYILEKRHSKSVLATHFIHTYVCPHYEFISMHNIMNTSFKKYVPSLIHAYFTTLDPQSAKVYGS